MNILVIINGEYGLRHVSNIQTHAPKYWNIEIYHARSVYPPIIDYPEDYLPANLPQADLILSFSEHRGVAELIPDIVKMTGAKSVIAPVDSEAWLPRGLARQLRGWLEKMQVVCVTPKPLCSLTETEYQITRRQRENYQDALISEFASYFGKPKFKISIDSKTRQILEVKTLRDAVCGCARFAAEGLVGISVDEAEEIAGLLHHHFPCLASMGIDIDFNDTLMHVSGNFMRDAVLEEIKPFKRYITPMK
jgi:hypothetical protein